MIPTPVGAALVVCGRKCARTQGRCAAALLTAALAFCPVAVRAQTLTTPANVSGDGAGNFPQVLVDSGGAIDIAYAERTGTNTVGGVRFVRSSDGGKTFSKPVAVAQSNASYFSMALESNCTIDIAYFQGSDVFFTQSSDCGKTFTPTNVTNSHGGGPPIGSDIQLVANEGVAQIVWVSNLTVNYAQRNFNGTFSAPVALFTQGQGSISLSKMAVSNGTTDVLWTAGEFNCQLYFLNSFNGAKPVAVLPRAEDLCGTVPFAVDPAGDVNIAWRDFDLNGLHLIRFVGSVGQSGNFGAPKSISYGSDPQIAAAANGKTGLAWVSGTNVMFTNSTDGGNTFSAPVNVTVAPSGSLVSEPRLALHGSSAEVAWGQGPTSGQGSDLWFSQSSDGGSNFSAPVNITKNQSSPSALQMITNSAGNILMVWSATVSTGHDVFFARSDANAGTFTIAATPASLVALPGGSATADVTLTATGEFDQSVNLSCGSLPAGAECTFNPAVVVPSSFGTHLGVRLTIPATLSTGGFPFTFNATSPTISQFQSMQISVGMFTGSVTPAAATIPVGGRASFAVTVASSGGFGGQFSLACSAPVGVTCTFSPDSAFLPINGRVSSTLTVEIMSTPATGGTPKNPREVFPLGLLMAQDVVPISGFVLLALSLVGFALLRKGESGRLGIARTAASIVLTVALTALLAATMLCCGGATNTRTSFLGTGAPSVGTGGTSGVPGTGGTGGLGGTGGSAGAGGATSGGVTTSGSTSVTFPLTVLAQAGASLVNIGTISVTVP